MLYWGISYWGTVDLPNAIHLIDNGRGGHTIDALYPHRIYDVGMWNADLLIFENTLINSAGTSMTGIASEYVASFNILCTYITGLSLDWFTLLPNSTTSQNINAPTKVRLYWDYVKLGIINKNISVIDVEKAFYKIWQYQNPNQEISYVSFLGSLMYDGSTHGNENAYAIYNRLLSPIFDMI